MSKSKIYEALLVISTGLLAIFLYGMIFKGESKPSFVYLAFFIGISGILVMPLGRLIAIAWYKLADALSFIMSKLIMTIVYSLILIPVATLYRLLKKDKLILKRTKHTKWTTRDHQYTADDLKNIW